MQRREQERAAKKQRREQRREELTKTMQTMTAEEREALKQQHKVWGQGSVGIGKGQGR